MRKAFLFIGLFTLIIAANAQPYLSVGKMFEVDQKNGCAPFTITITRTNVKSGFDCGTPKCLMNFDNSGDCPPNSNCDNVLKFTYKNPGTYKLQVTYTGSVVDSITVRVAANIQPAFDIHSCANSKVEIDIKDKTYDTYYVDFDNDGVNDGTIAKGITQTAIHKYLSPFSDTIKVKGQKTGYANNCSPKKQQFTTASSLPIPKIISLTALAGPTGAQKDTLRLAFTPATNVEYKSEIAIGNGINFGPYQTLYGVDSLTIPDVKLDNFYYCVKLGPYDPCANTTNYPIVPICSQKFSVTPTNGENQLSWTTSSPGISRIRILRNNILYDSAAATDTFYPDDSITCKKDYYYQLVSRYPSGVISKSLVKQVKAVKTTTPIGIKNTSAVVGEPQVDLVWLQDPAFKVASYQILRGPKGGSTVLIEPNSISPNYTDNFYNNSGNCYQINYKDNCDNASAPGLPSCPMVLGASLDELNDVTLDWSPYEGWRKGVKFYRILRYYQPGQTPQFIPPTGILTHSDNPNPAAQVIYYRVIAAPDTAGVSQSLSNEIKVVRNINLYYPTAFNPESKVSSLNKTFEVQGFFIKSKKLQVFDRWGALVFYSEDDEPWDGKRDGQPMPDGTYVWTVDGMDQAGSSFRKAGTVVLLRK